MRRSLMLPVIAIAMFVGAASPVHAEAWNFGHAECGVPFPCNAVGEGQLNTADLIATANSCALQKFGSLNDNGDLFENRGLNSKRCLTAKPMPSRPDGALVLVPKCCVQEDSKNMDMCRLVCDLFAGR